MKLFVDDIRSPKRDDWIVARTVNDAIRTIAMFDVKEISLDHDISHQVSIESLSRPYPCTECFCAVAYFIGEKYVDNRSAGVPKITIHTSNPVGVDKIQHILKDYGLEAKIEMTGLANRLEMEVKE